MSITTFDHIDFIRRIIRFSPRQHFGEIKTADFLETFLQEQNISFSTHKFKTTVPVEKLAILTADGKRIPCKSTCFVSGRIPDKNNVISSISDIEEDQIPYNINFNPYCRGISCASFYHHPAIAIANKNIEKILKAKEVKGLVDIQPTIYVARNVLVGNRKNPAIICFAHYDSILTGAWDNASGVAILMANILLHPETLENTLYVFIANEEVSYDKKPAYWCRGFRRFESKYLALLQNAKRIIVVDGVGITPSYWMTKRENLTSTIYFNNLDKFMPKIGIVLIK